MSDFEFGESSQRELETMHPDLQKIFELALTLSKVDFGISEGYRSIERQHRLFLQGKSKIDGISRKGKHNYTPSLAGDIYAYHPVSSFRRQIIYDPVHLSYIAGVMDAAAAVLLTQEEITHKLRWGGNWDSDGVIIYDQSFDDMPHFELVPA